MDALNFVIGWFVREFLDVRVCIVVVLLLREICLKSKAPAVANRNRGYYLVGQIVAVEDTIVSR